MVSEKKDKKSNHELLPPRILFMKDFPPEDPKDFAADTILGVLWARFSLAGSNVPV